MGHGSVEVTVLGDIARDVNVRITGVLPDDLVIAGDTPAHIRIVPGGSAATTAAWIAHTGASVGLIAARGDDDAGHDAERDLSLWGVTSQLQVIPGERSGTVVVLVDRAGERTMLPDPGANASLSPQWCVEHLVGSHLHVSAYTWYRRSTRACVEAAIVAARQRSMTVSLDLNSHGLVRDYRDDLPALLVHVDVLFGNQLEFETLRTSIASESLERVICVEKLGAAGARWTHRGSTDIVPGEHVPVVDTVGAGDAFAAGFLTSWIVNGNLQASLHSGNALAAQCLARVGPGPAPAP